MATTRPPWPEVKALFEQLLEQPAAARATALTEAAPALAAEVRALLAQHEAEESDGAGFLQAPPELAPPNDPDRRGQRLGPWELLARMGRGGMGEVWAARRADGAFEAQVAVKVLRTAVDTPSLRTHFDQETRALARLNHPHIARLLDAGTTPDDRPYFVMESVDGVVLDEACRGRALAARLALLLQLGDAVAHAHRHGLVHRDLKPANVLVTPDGQVKLLDFGIAQALDAAPDAPQAPRPLTPGFASPEQVRGEPVGPASDVYSLGVLLHLLLTGQRPYGRGATTAREVLAAVLEEPPTAPSRTPPAAGAEPGVARALLRGDLDAIVARALAKDIAMRYASVDALTADLRAHLAWQPVSARAPTWVYRSGRFVRRHRATVGAASLAGLALLSFVASLGASALQARDAVLALSAVALAGGFGVTAWQARVAARARDEARQRLGHTHALVRDIVMRWADAVTHLPGGLRIKADLLHDTLGVLGGLAEGAPGDALLDGERAKAHARLADLQVPFHDASLNQPEEAARNIEQALALFPPGEPAHRDDPIFYMWWARVLALRARTLRTTGDTLAALQWCERQRELLRATLPRFARHHELRHEYGSALIVLGQIYDTWFEPSLDRPEAALEAFAQAEAVYLELHRERPDDGDTLYQLGTVAGAQMLVAMRQGKLDEAAAHGRRGVAWREQALALAPLHTAYRDGVAGECNNLTNTLLRCGHVDEALTVSARGEAMVQALVAEEPELPTWVERRRIFAFHRGRALRAAGRPDEALPRLQDAMVWMDEATDAARVKRRGWCGLELALTLQALGRAQEARPVIDRAVADLARSLEVSPRDMDPHELLRRARALQQQLAG